MDEKVLLIGLNLLNGLLSVEEHPAFADLKNDVAALNAKVREKLPRKDDGTDWTVDDVKARIAEARAQLAEINRVIGPAPQADGDPGSGD